MSTAQPQARKRFPELDVTALQHPYDRAALQALQKVPGLDVIIRRFIELLPERVAYIQNVAQTIKVTPRQCPKLYASLQEACAILDVPEPELYVMQYPIANAWTSGHDHPYIIVTTGLIDLMDDDEILAVLGHELGHIKSGHVLYKTMARSITFLLEQLGQMTLGIGRLVALTLEAALLEWDRMAEFTADRAGMLVVQDPKVMTSLMMKFAGGSLFKRHELNVDDFLQQANLYEAVDANLLDRLYKVMMVSSVSHPLIIVRAKEILNWSGGTDYNDILEGMYPRVPVFSTNGSNPVGSVLVRCPHCGREQVNRVYCSLCGARMTETGENPEAGEHPAG
jgi:Zn-dependent protease with chaperone function